MATMPSLTSKNGHSHTAPRKGDTMRAGVWTGVPLHISMQTIPRPKLLTNEDVIVRLTSSAICGTDLHIYRGISGSANPPWVLGHEGVGIVQEIGDAVQLVKPGDRVIVPSVFEDGHFHIQPVPTLAGYGYGSEFLTNDGMQSTSPSSKLPMPCF
jgi:threonine dehydrogenase-like Zn-dependent dehydrogenase